MDSHQQTRRSSIKACELLEKAHLVNSGNELLWVKSVGVEKWSGGKLLQLV
jgi:hypothetical protein